MNFNEFLVKLGEQIEGLRLVNGQVITNGKIQFDFFERNDNQLVLGAMKLYGDFYGFMHFYDNFEEYINELKQYYPKDIKWRKEHYVQLNLWEASNS